MPARVIPFSYKTESTLVKSLETFQSQAFSVLCVAGKKSRPGSGGVKNSVRMVLTARNCLAHLTPCLRFQPAIGTLEHRFSINGRFFHSSTSSAVCSVTGCLKVCKGIGWSQCSVQHWMFKQTKSENHGLLLAESVRGTAVISGSRKAWKAC